MTKPVKIQRAFISVSDKTHLADLVTGLSTYPIEIISTGGTAHHLKEAGFKVRDVSDLTDFPEIMQGRVKSLHPLIHGGILGDRIKHHEEARSHHIAWIDLVVCTLYPFEKIISSEQTDIETAIEHIDIGGSAMIRAAAKNFRWVSVLTEPADYSDFLSELHEMEGSISYATRTQLSAKAFYKTQCYDAIIAQYLQNFSQTLPSKRSIKQSLFPAILTNSYRLKTTLRYGENPHQRAALYADNLFYDEACLLNATQLQGKPLSYNNMIDGDAALNCLAEFHTPSCVIIKHATPCGVACADNIEQAFQKAYNADSLSAFGSIIALNRPCTEVIAHFLKNVFVELIIAPSFEKSALDLFSEKPNMRVLQLALDRQVKKTFQLKPLSGGVLVQETDRVQLSLNALREVTDKTIDATLLADLYFAWHTVKHVKSNAIVIAENQVTLGIGSGQVSRIDAVTLALNKAVGRMQHAVLASDAFFPFKDSIEKIAAYPVRAIIQPGGSVKDQEVIDACNAYGIAMIFTDTRAFKH